MLLLAPAGCGPAGGGSPVAGVMVTPASVRLRSGTSVGLRAELTDARGRRVAGVPVRWFTQDVRTAVVDANGRVRGRAVGVTQVHAEAATARSAGVTVEVVAAPGEGRARIGSAVVQLQGYAGGRLDALAAGGYDLAVIDLARDAGSAYFSRDEIRRAQASNTKVLAYFEIGSLEDFRPDHASLRRRHPDLFLNEWPTWPGEYFVRYWDTRWWDLAVRPRIDRALAAGFDGVFLDSTSAFEEIDAALVPGETRETLGAKMADLIVRISAYGKAAGPGFLVFPNNSPELRRYPGYVTGIDGIAMESLFFRRTGSRCEQPYCASNLESARALRAAGKTVLAIDYTDAPDEIAGVCARYQQEGFVGYVAEPALATVRPPCE